ncbi:rho GTPase-activating protein 2 [Iris pallida]|uniref:Rho GTPase-activating protein 2 n=1 Tax=Iris pallida TaxID=29817 RepID=A0AAX6ILI2_IRIPA|nr:rho GTPase-activating protein 2 [Iris pallida]
MREMTGVMTLSTGYSGGCGGGDKGHVSVVALLLAAIRRSVASTCRLGDGGVGDDDVLAELRAMEIGFPTDVRHVAHVTFDRFEGFLGLPDGFDEFGRVPSASASVFGVSADSMQCCYDSSGNSVPTILLLMQERLYTQGGLKAEGIFRINPENSQEEEVREQLNKGIVPDDIDVHCLAGLIKAWFRELPEGVLDGLSPEQVLQCNAEDEFVELVKLLLPTPAALLNWAINLMADVVEEEDLNKMNARNIAMVFAPNMTQMSDPLTALMHAVQVMNLLKALILRTLRERAGEGEEYSDFSSSPSSEPQGHDDFDGEQDMDMSGELRIVTVDGCDDSREDDTMKDTEDCFSRRLEWKDHDENPVGGSIISLDLSSSDRTAQWTYSGSGCNVGSRLMLTWSKRESSSSSEDELSILKQGEAH